MNLFMGWLARERTFLLQEPVKYISFYMHDGDRLMARDKLREQSIEDADNPQAVTDISQLHHFFFSQLNSPLLSRNDYFLRSAGKTGNGKKSPK